MTSSADSDMTSILAPVHGVTLRAAITVADRRPIICRTAVRSGAPRSFDKLSTGLRWHRRDFVAALRYLVSMPRGLDHLVIPARDLVAQAEFYRRLGFQVGARNRHPWGTENHIIQFDGAFLELIGLGDGFVAPAPADDEFSFAGFVASYLARREGLAMLVLRSLDAEADRRAFAALGLGTFSRFDFARKGRRPDGTTVDVAFSLALAASRDWPATGFFVCQQHFPENFWSAAAQRHANGASGVARLRFVHPEPAAGAAFLEGFAASKAEPRGSGFTLPLENAEIQVAAGDGPAGMAGMDIRVADLDAQAARLAAQDVEFHRDGEAIATRAFGVALRFVA